MPNQFSINPLGGYDPGEGLSQALAGRDVRREKMELAAQRQKIQDAMAGAATGDPDAIDNLFAINPDLASKYEQRLFERQKREGTSANQAKVQAELAWAQKYKRAIDSGDELSASDLVVEAEADPLIDFDSTMMGKDLRQDQLVINTMLYKGMGKDAYKELVGGVGVRAGANIGAASPKDFTVESMAKYEETGNIGDLTRYSPKTVKVAGVEHQLNPETQKWEPIVDAASENLSIQTRALADIAADKKSRNDFAVSKTKWRTGKPKFKAKISSARASQGILRATADQIKSRISSLTTKYGASLSGIPGAESRTLKKQLDTLRAHSAFSTLTDLKASGGTLGAISEAELVLLESKLGALDQAGDPAELARVIDQIVNSNLSTIDRLEKEFEDTNLMYSKGFDDIPAIATPQQVPAQQVQPKIINWADL